MTEENGAEKKKKGYEYFLYFVSGAFLGVLSALVVSFLVHFYIIMQGQQAGLAFLVTIPYTIRVVLPSGAVGGALGSLFYYQRDKDYWVGAFIGGGIASIIAFTIGLVYISELPYLFL